MVALVEPEINYDDALREQAKRSMKKDFRSFFMGTEPKNPYYYGTHTNMLLDKLQWVMDEVEAGRNVYVIINFPPRHGKSDVVSRRFPVWSLIRHPDWEYILSSYNHELASDMSLDARRCFRSAAPMYGGTISRERDQITCWRTNQGGAMYAAGLGGTIVGRGANIFGIDDYLKNREDAESMVMRDKVWDSFRSDFMTRLAPVHAVIIVANRWHQDDLVGRIKRMNDPEGEDYDEDFPVFEIITCPAQNEDGSWLFPERLNDAWYRAERSLVGSYGWDSLFQQDPIPRRGNRMRVDMVHWVDDIDKVAGKDATWEWGFDLAHSDKETNKSDPDYTHGTLGCVQGRNIYIKDVLEIRKSALKRDAIIQEKVEASGSNKAIIEVVGAAKDAFVTLKAMLSGVCLVHKYTVQRDLTARASFLEPIFEAGNVYAQNGKWKKRWENWMKAFPSGAHDDAIASLVALTYKKLARKGILSLSR